MTGVELLVALAIAVGLVGILVPVLPGSVLVLAAILVWAWEVGAATALATRTASCTRRTTARFLTDSTSTTCAAIAHVAIRRTSRRLPGTSGQRSAHSCACSFESTPMIQKPLKSDSVGP